MILSTYQPYFSPFPGFFHKAFLSDIFVILDDVQFPRGTTWISRNRFKNDQGALWMTIPVKKKGLGLQSIHQVRVHHEGRWAAKHLASLKSAYRHAPYFKDHEPFLTSIFTTPYARLVDLNLAIIDYLMNALGIHTKVLRLSEAGIAVRGNRLPVQLCNQLGASCYLAQASARYHLDSAMFTDAGVRLEFFVPSSPVYPQLWGKFIPNLSAFDLLFNCGPKALDILLKR